MATVNVALNIQVTGGPQIPISRTKSIEAYDKIEVAIEPSAPEKVVEIQPSTASQVSFLLIKSNLYSENDAAKKLTYVVSDGSTDSSTIELDEPHLFLGKGAVSVFGLAPRVLKFSSTYVAAPNNPNRATIEILVGRDPTP